MCLYMLSQPIDGKKFFWTTSVYVPNSCSNIYLVLSLFDYTHYIGITIFVS